MLRRIRFRNVVYHTCHTYSLLEVVVNADEGGGHSH